MPAWGWILLGWLFGGLARIILDDSLGQDAGPVSFIIVLLVWTPALRRLASCPGRNQAAFAGTLIATILLVGLSPGFESLAVRLPVEIALTGAAAARWIDGSIGHSKAGRKGSPT
jgi:hypothetical protein